MITQLKSLKHKSLQNKSGWDKEKPTIIINANSPEWEQAYKNWLDGKNPTDSPLWKEGVFMTFE